MVATDSAFFKGLLLVAILAPSIGCAAGYKKTPPSTNSTGPVTVQLTPLPHALAKRTTTVHWDRRGFRNVNVTWSGSNNGIVWEIDNTNHDTGGPTILGEMK